MRGGQVQMVENIHVEGQDVWYLFHPRRAIHDVPACLAQEKIYRDMMKGVKIVRVVGEFSGVRPNASRRAINVGPTSRMVMTSPRTIGQARFRWSKDGAGGEEP